MTCSTLWRMPSTISAVGQAAGCRVELMDGITHLAVVIGEAVNQQRKAGLVGKDRDAVGNAGVEIVKQAVEGLRRSARASGLPKRRRPGRSGRAAGSGGGPAPRHRPAAGFAAAVQPGCPECRWPGGVQPESRSGCFCPIWRIWFRGRM